MIKGQGPGLVNVLWAEAQNDADQYRETVRNQQREATTSQSERITKRAHHKASTSQSEHAQMHSLSLVEAQRGAKEENFS